MLIETERCIIRNMAIGDAESLYEVLSDPQAMACVEPPFSMERTCAFLREAGMSEPPLVYAVCSKADGKVIGHLIFHPYEGGSYELGWILNRRYWRRGVASELTGAVIEYARQQGISSIVIECSPKQRASIAIAEKAGFSFCGVREGCNIYLLKLT